MAPGSEGRGHDILSPQATGVHSTDNCWVLDEHCGTPTVAARAVQFLSSASSSSSQGPGQAAVVARASSMHTVSCGGELQVPT